MLGPDHVTTLLAGNALTLALLGRGEVESARALGQDTLERARQMLGPDNPITVFAATAHAAATEPPNPDQDYAQSAAAALTTALERAWPPATY